MLCKVENDSGKITIQEEVIGNIITETLAQFRGKVWLSNHKGKLMGSLSRLVQTAESDYMEIFMGEKGIEIRFFVVIRFGTSIRMVTETLIEDIKTDVKKYTGLSVNSVAIVVTGMISKHIARRNIEIRG